MAAPHPTLQHVPLLVRRWITERDPQQEAIELGLGERIRALVLHGVGGREHVEWRSKRERLTLDGHLPFLHRLEQGRLCLRGRAVDLVSQEQPSEDRPGPEHEVRLALVVHEGTRHV